MSRKLCGSVDSVGKRFIVNDNPWAPPQWPKFAVRDESLVAAGVEGRWNPAESIPLAAKISGDSNLIGGAPPVSTTPTWAVEIPWMLAQASRLAPRVLFNLIRYSK